MGTPMGKHDVMKRWNDSITARPTVVGVPPDDTASTRGNRYSIDRAAVGQRRRPGPTGRRSSGYCRYMAFFSAGTGSTGELLTMIVTTLGKWWLSFERGRPPPDGQLHDHRPGQQDRHVVAREGEDDQHRPVVLGPGRQEHRLVPQAEHGEDRDHRDQQLAVVEQGRR